jgi:hypothetical protein
MLVSFAPRFGSPDCDDGDKAVPSGGALVGGTVVVVVVVEPDWDPLLLLPLAPVPSLPPLSGTVGGTVLVGGVRDGNGGKGKPKALAAPATAPVMVGSRESSGFESAGLTAASVNTMVPPLPPVEELRMAVNAGPVFSGAPVHRSTAPATGSAEVGTAGVAVPGAGTTTGGGGCIRSGHADARYVFGR